MWLKLAAHVDAITKGTAQTMFEDILLVSIPALCGLIGVIITAFVTSKIKDKESDKKVTDAAQSAAASASLETAKLQIRQHNEIQEDLRAARGENHELYLRLERLNRRFDGLYRTLSQWRNYADRLRNQIIEAGMVPIPWEEHIQQEEPNGGRY